MDGSAAAFHIVKTLVDAGHIAYYAGGWVRDFILSRPSGDIDIATSAHPEEVQKIFPRTVAIGASFGVVVVVLDHHRFEVATFRSDGSYLEGRRPQSVAFTGPEEDALRRDFTINGMFYDPIEEKIYDFVNGRKDLERKIVSAIGDPYERFLEDRLRMVRAVRFSVRFSFSIDPTTREAIKAYASELFPSVSIERVWQELCRMIQDGHFDKAVVQMYLLGLLEVIFPALRGIGRSEIEKRAASLSFFPKEAPSILFLMKLFPFFSLSERLDLCRYLKTANKDCREVVSFFQASDLISRGKDAELADLTHFYASNASKLYLNLISLEYREEKERRNFLSWHSENFQKLKRHIQRVREKKPLVTSALLHSNGIPSGKGMGALLKEAERISVNCDLHDPEAVLSRLKKSSLWPEEVL